MGLLVPWWAMWRGGWRLGWKLHWKGYVQIAERVEKKERAEGEVCRRRIVGQKGDGRKV